MPNLTSNFSFNKPLVNDPIDEDLWGAQLNANWDSIDTILDALTPIGTRVGYTGTSAPNSRWLLGYGQAVSRTTYSAYFALVSTAYGVGDGSTTFNMPDYRGRAGVGLDNLGGSSANRLTDANADSLNNTGLGSETDAGTNGTTGSTAITQANLPASVTLTQSSVGDVNNSSTGSVKIAASQSGARSLTYSVGLGSGSGHTHAGSTWTGTTGANAQPSIAEASIIRVL